MQQPHERLGHDHRIELILDFLTSKISLMHSTKVYSTHTPSLSI